MNGYKLKPTRSFASRSRSRCGCAKSWPSGIGSSRILHSLHHLHQWRVPHANGSCEHNNHRPPASRTLGSSTRPQLRQHTQLKAPQLRRTYRSCGTCKGISFGFVEGSKHVAAVAVETARQISALGNNKPQSRQ